MVEAGSTALGMEGGTMLLVDRDEVARLADGAGITVVSVDEPV
jgi:DUF1009 family protein